MSELLWAIDGKYGLFLGTWFSREAAIAGHLMDLQVSSQPTITWADREAAGDKVVRVRVTVLGVRAKPKRKQIHKPKSTAKGLTFREAVDRKRLLHQPPLRLSINPGGRP